MGDAGVAIYGRLRNTTGITGIVNTRIYPVVLPQSGDLPAITFNKASDVGIHASGQDPNIHSPRWQVHGWSTSYTQVRNLADQIKECLRDYSGSTWVAVQRFFFDGEIDLTEVDPLDQSVIYHTVADFICWYSS